MTTSPAIMPEPTGEADLYQVEPGQFTAGRNALAKRLRAEGQRDEAARVGKLRRPPVTAWALNQIARHQPDLIGAVLDSGERLRAAMEKAVGGDASGLRHAKGAQRQAVDTAVAAATKCLQAAGHPGNETTKQRMGATLGAAVVDEAVARELRNGVLDGDRSAPGFGLEALAPADPAPVTASNTAADTDRAGHDRATPGGQDGRAPADQRVDRAGGRQAQAALRERHREARARHAALEAEASRLAHRAERLQTRAEEAERLAADARAAADAATAEADDARRRAESAVTGC